MSKLGLLVLFNKEGLLVLFGQMFRIMRLRIIDGLAWVKKTAHP